MEQVCNYIMKNIYNKKSMINFIKMDVEDILNIDKYYNINDYITNLLKSMKFKDIKNIAINNKDIIYINEYIQINDYITKKLVNYLKPYNIGFNLKNKSYKIILNNELNDYREFDIIIYNNYWMVTLYPIEE
jgi:hypothetical protein